MFYFQDTYEDILDFICFLNKKTYYCNSKRNSSVFEVCYDLSKRKEIQGQRSLPPHCLSQQVTILNFTQLCCSGGLILNFEVFPLSGIKPQPQNI